MTDTIKITTLSQMGTTIPGPTLVPVVDMSGVPTTKKATVANIANAILSQAGNGYAYAAKANLANTAGSAGTVSNAAQPNITSVGTLTSLAVSGTTNLGPVGNVIISGGTVGQVLTTDGSNILSWSTVAGGNSTPAGSNTQLQFNDDGAFGGSANLTFDNTTNNLTLAGNVIAQSGVYSNIISSIGNSNIELWINHPTGFSYVFTIGGALQIPGGHLLESNGNGAFELKSGNGIVISSDIGNTNQSFSFRTDGVFHAPGNVELEGTRLSVGPGASNVTLEGATVVVNANSNVYVQAALTNENPNGSADWTAYGTNGDDTGGWTDFGFTGYNFNDANYTITGPGDGYLFAHAYANGAGGGSLILATGDHGTLNDIIFATNGFATENEFGRISHANNALELTRANSKIVFAGNSVVQSIANSSLDTLNPNVSTMVFTPDSGYSAQALVLDPTAPGHIHLRSPSDNIDEPYANVFLGGEDTAFEITSGANNQALIHSGGNTWTFGNDGILTLPGEGVIRSNDDTVIIQSYDTGNAISKSIRLGTNGSLYFEDDGNAWLTIDNVSNNAVLTAAANSYVRIASNNGSENWYFESDGNLTLSGNTVAINFANGTPAFGNIVSVSLDGNVSNALIGDGTFGAVAIKETGSWTLASGVNTVSISVPVNGTYAIWINGNIPNGIATYTATAVVTNTNVPVLGEQYAWYYETGNALVFTSIPDQFVGTQGAISNATPYLGNTANVFTFGITNNSGSSQVVDWGYTKL